MNWETNFINACSKYNIEPVQIDGKMLFICPKMPSEEIQKEILSTFPKPEDVVYKFVEQPRMETMEGLKILFGKAGAKHAEMAIEGHTLLINISSDSPVLTETESDAWPVITQILRADPFVEGWVVKVNDTVMSQYDAKLAKMLENHAPERIRSITDEDVLNLRISLETAQDVNDFINSL